MRVGITGTQHGATHKQVAALAIMLRDIGATELHHGDCVGADMQAHSVAKLLKIPVVIHPPRNPSKRAFCSGAIRTMPEDEYIERNHHIVDATDMLIAMPREYVEQVRSGTWATYRYAKRGVKPSTIIYPDGTTFGYPVVKGQG